MPIENTTGKFGAATTLDIFHVSIAENGTAQLFIAKSDASELKLAVPVDVEYT